MSSIEKLHILPLSPNEADGLGGRTRLQFLSPELKRMRDAKEVLTVGHVFTVESVDYVVMRVEPGEGILTHETDYFLDGGLAPMLEKVHFLGIEGPTDSSDEHLFNEYVKPFFAERICGGSRTRGVLAQSEVICYKDAKLVVCACDPGSCGVVHADTVVFANWDRSQEYEHITKLAEYQERLRKRWERRPLPLSDGQSAASTSRARRNSHAVVCLPPSSHDAAVLQKVQILPLSNAIDEVLNGRNRLEFLAAELRRIRDAKQVLSIGDLIVVEGVELAVIRAIPAAGVLSLLTDYFLDEGLAPSLTRVHFVGVYGPRDIGDIRLFTDYVKPYFQGYIEKSSQKRRLLRQNQVVQFNGAKFALMACEPESPGLITGQTEIFASWDATPDFHRIHCVPFQHTMPDVPDFNVFEECLKRYFDENPVAVFSKDEVFSANTVQFKVVCCEPEGPARLGPQTIIFWEGTLPMDLHFDQSTLMQMSVEDLYSRWLTSRVRAALPEYQPAVDQICVADRLMTTSSLGRQLAYLEDRLRNKALQRLSPAMEKAAIFAVQKAFSLTTEQEARTHVADVAGLSRGNMFLGAMHLYKTLGWEKPYLVEALTLLCDSEDAAGLQITLGLMRRGSDECHARKVYAFNAIVGRVPAIRPTGGGTQDATDVETSRNAVLEVLSDLIEETKDAAVKSTFLEPTKMYFRAMKNFGGESDVDVHGANTYLAIILAALGIAISRRPHMNDDAKVGVADFLGAGMEGPLAVLWAEEHFGHDWDSIGLLRRHAPVATRRAAMHFIFGEVLSLFGSTTAREVANAAVNPESPPVKRRHLAAYLNQFTYWFSVDFIVPRMISRLLGEQGRPDALQTLRDDLASFEPQWAPEEGEEDVRFWLWDMESLPAVLRTDRAVRLLQHADALK